MLLTPPDLALPTVLLLTPLIVLRHRLELNLRKLEILLRDLPLEHLLVVDRLALRLDLHCDLLLQSLAELAGLQTETVPWTIRLLLILGVLHTIIHGLLIGYRRYWRQCFIKMHFWELLSSG